MAMNDGGGIRADRAWPGSRRNVLDLRASSRRRAFVVRRNSSRSADRDSEQPRVLDSVQLAAVAQFHDVYTQQTWPPLHACYTLSD